MDDVVSFQKRERSLTSDQRASVLKLNGLTISIGDTSLLMSPRILMGPVDLTLVYQYLKKLNRLHDDIRTEVSRDLPHFRAREKELSIMAPAMQSEALHLLGGQQRVRTVRADSGFYADKFLRFFGSLSLTAAIQPWKSGAIIIAERR